MFEVESRINEFLVQYCQMLSADIPDERFTEQPIPGVNHPAWILGHLAIAGESAVVLLGGQRELPQAWSKLCGPGSILTSMRSDYPAKAELLNAIESTYRRARDIAPAARTEQLARPNPNRRLRDGLPTVSDACSFILTAHFSLHLGQFSTWRRIIGLTPLF